jgi:hypothetical protein
MEKHADARGRTQLRTYAHAIGASRRSGAHLIALKRWQAYQVWYGIWYVWYGEGLCEYS